MRVYGGACPMCDVRRMSEYVRCHVYGEALSHADGRRLTVKRRPLIFLSADCAGGNSFPAGERGRVAG